MNNLNKNLIGSTIAAATIIAGSMAIAPAQAASLNGGISLSGGSNIVGDTVKFSNAGDDAVKVQQVQGDFANLLSDPDFIEGIVGKTAKVKDLALSDADSNGRFSNNAIASFIDFGKYKLNDIVSQLTFDLDAGNDNFVKSTFGSSSVSFQNLGGIRGVFKFGSETLGVGFVNASSSFGAGSSQISLETVTAKATPEPVATLGLLTVAALGAASTMRKRFQKAEN